MIENKKTLFIPDSGVQIVYEKTEGNPFGSIVIQMTKIEDSEKLQDLEFFVDQDSILIIQKFFIKVCNEWI